MFEREIKDIKVKKDIVGRTANNLAETFENLEIKCEIIKNGTKINALSLIGLLNLDVRKDCIISLLFDGDSQKIDKAVRYLLDEKII